MADYIDKWQAVANLMDAHLKDTAKAVDAIQFMDVADVRPVVLCKDCKYWKLSKIEPSFHVCTYICGATFVRNQDDFCSRGEKREES